MTPAELQSQIIGFLVYSIPLVVALWKIFAWLESIQDRLEHQIRDVDRRLTDLDHRSELRSREIEALNDKVALAVNGVKELVNHLRARTKADDDAIAARLRSLEGFIAKTTDYQPRV